MHENLALLALFVLVYSSIAGAVERSWISGPIVFTCFGLLIGPVGLDLLSWQTDRETIGNLAELALALVLFTDAASVDMAKLKRAPGLPVRLLLIGLPLTILLGYAVGTLFVVDVSPFALALLATILAPTDAALGKGVVTNESVSEEIRQGLNVESGLNDGICVPILFVFLALALGEAGEGGPWGLAVGLVIEAIGIGAGVGVVLTLAAGWLLRFAWHRGWVTHTWIQLPVLALALGSFATAQLLGGSGFIAAFFAGALFGYLVKHEREALLRAAEGTGDTLALVTWVVFGAAVVAKAVAGFNWLILLYAVLSLTLIRMLPVFIALIGSGLDTEGKLFVGWFGPRGLASVVFAIIVLDSGLPASGPMATVVACTVILSILAHGITANVWARTMGEHQRKALLHTRPHPTDD